MELKSLFNSNLKIKQMGTTTTTETEIQKFCRRKFSHLSNIQLVERINNAPDFGWDDEEVELCRRRAVSEGKFVVKMNFSTIEIIKDETI